MDDHIKDKLKALENEELETNYFRKVLCDTPEGRYVFAMIMHRTGNYRLDKTDMNLDLIAFGNWLLSCCGILNDYNFSDMIDALSGINNAEYLLLRRKHLKTEGE